MAFKQGTFQVLLLFGLGMHLPTCIAQIPVATPSFMKTTPATTTPSTLSTPMTDPPTTSTTMAPLTDPTTQPMPDTTPPITDPVTQPPAETTPLVVTTQVTEPTAPTSAPTTAPTTAPAPPPCPEKCSCNNQTRIVECQMASLTSIPTDIPEYTTMLYLNENNFNVLPRGAFIDLPNLIALHLISCGIQSIANGAFNGLSHLRYLSLKANHLTSVQGVLQGMPELRELDLEQNRLSTFSDAVLRDLPALRTLSIGNNNQLSEVSPGTFQYNTLMTSLRISHCNLNAVPQMVFQPLTNLERLDLSGNVITQILPGAFDGLQSLRELMLSSLSIQQINDMAFAGLSQLKTLDLGYNNLQNLDMGVFMPLSSLRTLILTGSPWNCNCRMRRFFDWLKTTQIDYFSASWVCYSPNRLMGQPVYTIDAEDFACVPLIYQKPNSINIPFGENKFFECRAYGDPTPQIEWYGPDGMQITAMSNAQNVYTALNNTVLVIQSPEEVNGGHYNCTAKNSNGASSTAFSISVTGIPTSPVPTTAKVDTTASIDTPQCAFAPIDVKVGIVTDTTVEIQWSSYNDPQLLNYILETTEFGAQESDIILVSKENTTFIVTDLNPGSNYILCVSVRLSICPSIVTYDQCKLVTTGGIVDDGTAALNVKHRNEIIGTFLATFLGTLLILASLFIILWQYRKPKSYTKYDFKSTVDSAQFADLDDRFGETSREEVPNPQIRYTGSFNMGATLDEDDLYKMKNANHDHDAEVYSIPPDAHPVYATPVGKGKGKGKRGSQAPLVEIELDNRNSSEYILPKEQRYPVLEAKVVEHPGQESHEGNEAEFGHLYEEVDSPKSRKKLDHNPVTNGVPESNGHVDNSTAKGHARNGSANKVRFSLPEDEKMTQYKGNGDITTPEIMTV